MCHMSDEFLESHVAHLALTHSTPPHTSTPARGHVCPRVEHKIRPEAALFSRSPTTLSPLIMRSTILLVGLAVSPVFGRPLDPSLDRREDPMPVLVLPPSILKNTTTSRVLVRPSQGLIIPLFNSNSDQGSATIPAGPVLATTLTVAAAPPTQTVHVAGTTTITVTVKEQPAAPTINPPKPTQTDSAPVHAHENGSGSGDDKPFMATYFPDWTGDEFPPEKVDFNRFEWVDFGKSSPRLTSLLLLQQAN